MDTIGVLCVFTFFGLAQKTCGQMCPDEWTSFGGSCYTLGSELLAWTDAEEMCRLYDADLAVIESQNENEFLKRFLNEHHSASHVWIGATDIFNEGHFMWLRSFKSVAFNDWSVGEPNQAHGSNSEDCVQMRREFQWQWNDESCAQTDHFVCELELGGTGGIIG